MNVLILTPDAVGSTLLQRLVTIYMQFHEFDRPVINLHELTNGLEKYFSPEFGCEIVSKKRVSNWGYYQTLEQVVEILSSVDHYKTSRLAHYHIKRRRDSIDQQIPFYQYLNSNFFVIACRRHNVFEHALSMAISRITGKLNVYSHDEKIGAFCNLYRNGITVDQTSLQDILRTYHDYIAWSNDHFEVASHFYYDSDLINIEQYILTLPIFAGQSQSITWKQKFDVSFDDWNKLHHMPSDLAVLTQSASLEQVELDATVQRQIVADYQTHAPPEMPAIHSYRDFCNLDAGIRDQRLIPYINQNNQGAKQFLLKNSEAYSNVSMAFQRMQELDIIVSPPPIKKQTLWEKMRTVKNLEACIDTYNCWIDDHADLGSPVTQDQLWTQAEVEYKHWHQYGSDATHEIQGDQLIYSITDSIT